MLLLFTTLVEFIFQERVKAKGAPILVHRRGKIGACRQRYVRGRCPDSCQATGNVQASRASLEVGCERRNDPGYRFVILYFSDYTYIKTLDRFIRRVSWHALGIHVSHARMLCIRLNFLEKFFFPLRDEGRCQSCLVLVLFTFLTPNDLSVLLLASILCSEIQ